MLSLELNARGAGFEVRGDFEGARLHYLAALSADPHDWIANANLVRILSDKGQLVAALAHVRRAASLNPGDLRLKNDEANLLMRLDRHQEAAAIMQNLRDSAPDDSITWENSALVAYRMGRYREALDFTNRAIELSPGNLGLRSNRAHVMLALGENLAEALAEYEYRWYSLIHLPPWDLYIPEWNGEDLRGKRLLFHSEQGFGDAIQMSRYARNLADLGAKVSLGLPPGLIRLFEEQNWRGVEVVNLASPGSRDDFDYHSPMFSAFRWLGIERDQISPVPYIKTPSNPIVLPPEDFKIGICWASGKWNLDTALRRTIPLELFLPLATIPGVSLYSLQKGEDESAIQTVGAEGLIIDVMPAISDWADTTRLLASLDLVVAVDTAVAHLAAAMGKEVLMLSPFTRCWRWWDIGHSDTGRPWYSTMNIIPQVRPGSWVETMPFVESEVRVRVENRYYKAAA